jgi:predicted nuclease of restriction endonuclease-like RecB superfamily
MILEAERSPEHVADQFGISLADVHAALWYYYDNPDEMTSLRERHDALEEKLAERAVGPDRAEQ